MLTFSSSTETMKIYLNCCVPAGQIWYSTTSVGLLSVTVQDLKNFPCILVTSKEQRGVEQAFCQTVIGNQSEILYAENLEETRMMVITGQGFLPVEGSSSAMTFDTSICRILLYRGEKQITRNYCLFWKKDNSGYYVEKFADILKRKFE